MNNYSLIRTLFLSAICICFSEAALTAQIANGWKFLEHQEFREGRRTRRQIFVLKAAREGDREIANWLIILNTDNNVLETIIFSGCNSIQMNPQVPYRPFDNLILTALAYNSEKDVARELVKFINHENFSEVSDTTPDTIELALRALAVPDKLLKKYGIISRAISYESEQAGFEESESGCFSNLFRKKKKDLKE